MLRERGEAVVHPNYILVYELSDETVEIMRIIHTRRQYPFPD
ncbi:MAG TPA: type II toxin-antitoxin system RelE/ParE family toxin [Novosphingobium sp.]